MLTADYELYRPGSVMFASTCGSCHPERQRRISSIEHRICHQTMRSFAGAQDDMTVLDTS
jgi:hypothetical protein